MPDRFVYSVTKGAILTMTYSIAIDYVKKGIRCNCIAPARIHTPFVDGFVKKSYPGKEEETLKKLSEYQPLGRMGRRGSRALWERTEGRPVGRFAVAVGVPDACGAVIT